MKQQDYLTSNAKIHFWLTQNKFCSRCYENDQRKIKKYRTTSQQENNQSRVVTEKQVFQTKKQLAIKGYFSTKEKAEVWNQIINKTDQPISNKQIQQIKRFKFRHHNFFMNPHKLQQIIQKRLSINEQRKKSQSLFGSIYSASSRRRQGKQDSISLTSYSRYERRAPKIVDTLKKE